MPGGAPGPELAHLLAKGVEAEAKALGNILLATTFDEDGAQSFVQALGVVRRSEEEIATRCIVHNGMLGCESFRWPSDLRRIANPR